MRPIVCFRATYTGSCADATEANGIQGNLSSSAITVPADKDDYVISGNQIHKVTGNAVTVGQYKGYITLTGITTSSARGMNFIEFDSETTGISVSLNDNEQMTNDLVVYDLQARRMDGSRLTGNGSRLIPGLYIMNGKKVVIK